MPIIELRINSLLSLDDRCAATASTWAEQEAAKGVQITCQASSHSVVTADRGRLIQVLDNLMENAVHAASHSAPQGGAVTISTACENDFARIDIMDDGRGFTPAATPILCTSSFAASRRLIPTGDPNPMEVRKLQPNSFHDANCVSKSWHKREARRCPGRMSAMPHSSASHQSSAVLEEVTSTIGIEISIQLTRSTRSLQLPSARASSVTITVFSRAELSESTAALMVRAHCITVPCASMSCATVASGLLLDTKITVPARL